MSRQPQPPRFTCAAFASARCGSSRRATASRAYGDATPVARGQHEGPPGVDDTATGCMGAAAGTVDVTGFRFITLA